MAKKDQTHVQEQAPEPEITIIEPEQVTKDATLEPDASSTAPARTFPKGYRTYLYSTECPAGRIFEGDAATEALAAGWVESPADLRTTKQP